jgi:hypothetical protein
MKKITRSLGILLFGAIAVFQFCVKPPDYPDEPVITFESLSKDVMYQSTFGQDSVIITFAFTDGDGDLGFKDDAEESIFIVDGRDSFQKPSYRIPHIEQQGAGNGISGSISIVVPTTCCIYPPPLPPCDTINAPQQLDTVFYLIRIKDRAGHLSNEIQTGPITLICRRQ